MSCRSSMAWSRSGVVTGLIVCGLLLGCRGGADQAGEPTAEQNEPAFDCGAHPGLIEQIECYANRATRLGHPRPCREAAHEGVRYQCYAILAERLKDASLCDDIPASSDESRALRDSCLSDVAAILEESALCERIGTPGLRDSCYFKIAGATGDSGLCESIADPGLKSGCSGQPVMVD